MSEKTRKMELENYLDNVKMVGGLFHVATIGCLTVIGSTLSTWRLTGDINFLVMSLVAILEYFLQLWFIWSCGEKVDFLKERLEELSHGENPG